MRKLLFLLAIANLGQAPAVKGGTVTGTVQAVLDGQLDKTAKVYVYLEPTGTVTSAIGKGWVEQVMQQGAAFTPSIVIIPFGATIYFPNRDNDEHNVWSPGLKKGVGFNLGRYGFDKTGKPRKFIELGEHDIYCDIHKDMWAKVKVIPSRYFVEVKKDGSYALTDVAPGTYRLHAWAPDSAESITAKTLGVTADSKQTAESLNVQIKHSNHAHTRRDGSPYPPYPKP